MAKTCIRCIPKIPLAVYANDSRLMIRIPRMLRNGFSERYWRVVSLDSVFATPTLTSADENRQHIFDSDVLHSFLNKIDSLNDTECSLFALFLVNQYSMQVPFVQSEFRH